MSFSFLTNKKSGTGLVAPWCHQGPQFLLDFYSDILTGDFEFHSQNGHPTSKQEEERGNRMGWGLTWEVRLLVKSSAHCLMNMLRSQEYGEGG